jgi:hypothetical protein
MPVTLPQEVEDLLKAMSPEDATAFRKSVESNPKLAEGWLRQSDYDRRMNEGKAELQKEKAKANEWVEWSKTAKPQFEQMKTDYEKLQQEKAELQRKIEAAAITAGGGEGDEAAITKRVEERLKSIGNDYVPKSEVDKIIAAEAKKVVDSSIKEERERFFAETLPAQAQFNLDLQEINADHKAETGKWMDRKVFSDFMKAEGLTDPKKAYDKFMSGARTEKEIERRVQEEVKKRNSQIGLPGTSGVSVPSELGPLQVRIQHKDAFSTAHPDAKVEVGDGQLGAAAAAALRAEGKF